MTQQELVGSRVGRSRLAGWQGVGARLQQRIAASWLLLPEQHLDQPFLRGATTTLPVLLVLRLLC
jgi:hypothetical protein